MRTILSGEGQGIGVGPRDRAFNRRITRRHNRGRKCRWRRCKVLLYSSDEARTSGMTVANALVFVVDDDASVRKGVARLWRCAGDTSEGHDRESHFSTP